METKHKPATPLPWSVTHQTNTDYSFHVVHQQPSGAHRIADVGASVDPASTVGRDAAYIVHAANNYGRLVEALRFIANRADIKDGDDPLRECAHIKGSAASLLRELGESD